MARFTGGTLFPVSFGTALFPDQFDTLRMEEWLSGTSSAQTLTAFTMSLPTALDIQYSGTNFIYDANGNVIDGNIAGLSITSSRSGELWLTLEDVDISVADFQAYVATGNTQAFLSFILADGDTLLGSAGAGHADILNGFAGDDSVNGSDGDDILLGGTGNDTLNGGKGGDRLFGGSGDDTYVVGDSWDYLDETGGGLDTVVFEGEIFDLALHSFGEIENIDIIGTGSRAIVFANDLGNRIVSSRDSNYLQGLGGNDTVTVADGNDYVDGGWGNDSIDGAGGNDYLQGSIGNDTLDGGDGNDSLSGDSGFDTLRGGAGDDRYYVNSTDVIIETSGGAAGGIDSVVHVGSGLVYTLGANLENLYANAISSAVGNSLNNSITLGVGSNRIFGLEGNDSLDGAGGNDTLDGSAGNDTLVGGSGADFLSGGSGNDRYWIDNAGDRIGREAAGASGGIDTVTTSVNFTLGANLENLNLDGSTSPINGIGNNLSNRITGNDGANRLFGLGGADEIFGEGGNDYLNGGAGNDTLMRGMGSNTLVGGLGNDEFRYEPVLYGYDLITGFDGNAAGGQDHFDLDALFDSIGLVTADRAARVQLTDRGANVDVRVDSDGDGLFDIFAATLQTGHAITAGNSASDDVILGTL